MIILKKESDVKKLKRWDSRQSQEHLDLVEKSTWELDYAEFDRIATKWNNLVDSHIRELDKKDAEEYDRKLNEKALRTIVDLPVIWSKSVLELSENWINTIEDVKNNIDLVFKLLKLSKEDQLKLSSAL